MDLRQQSRFGPARQNPAQGRSTGLIRGGRQAAPGRAFAQKAPQCRHNPDRFGRWVARATVWLLVAGVDNRGDEMKELEVHCRCPCLVPQTWAAAAQNRRSTQPSVVVKTASKELLKNAVGMKFCCSRRPTAWR